MPTSLRWEATVAKIEFDLNDILYEALKNRAVRNQRSLEAEVHAALATSLRDELREEFLRWTKELREQIRPHDHGDATADIRADRDSH